MKGSNDSVVLLQEVSDLVNFGRKQVDQITIIIMVNIYTGMSNLAKLVSPVFMSQFLRREETGVPGGNPRSQVEIE